MDIFTFILARNSAGGGGGSVKKGSARTPNTSIAANPQITVDGEMITASVNASDSITPTVVPGYVSKGIAGAVQASGEKSVRAGTLEPNLQEGNIKAGVSIFGHLGSYVGGDGGIVNGNVLIGKSNGYGIIVEGVVGISWGVVGTATVKKTDDGWLNCSIPATQNPATQDQSPYTIAIKPYDANNTKISAVSGNTGGTPYVSNTVAYVPVFSGDIITVTIKDN